MSDEPTATQETSEGNGKPPQVTVVRSTAATKDPEPKSVTEASPAPKKRGRPPGSGKPRSKPVRKEVSESSMCRVRATMKIRSSGPNGEKIYFDRAISATGASASEAAKTASTKLASIYETWEKIYTSTPTEP